MSGPLRVLILTPTLFPAITGNAVTTERWREHLTKKGAVARTFATQGCGPDAVREAICGFAPHVIHAHHASKAGALLLDPLVAPHCAHIPLAVSPAGTDILRHGEGPSAHRASVLMVFRRAAVIITQGPWTAETLEEWLHELRDRFVYVPKAFAWFGDAQFDLRLKAGWGGDTFVFFLPAGIRPVKGNLECLRGLERVHAARPHVRAVFAGPPLDPEYAARFEAEVRRLSTFVHWIPMIPPGAMQSAYKTADVVLNGSFSEGLSNALLEAIAAGRPVLASDIAGNRWPLMDEKGSHPCGLFFDPSNPADFAEKALRLIDDEELRADLSRAAVTRASSWPTPIEEAKGLLRAYREAMDKAQKR